MHELPPAWRATDTRADALNAAIPSDTVGGVPESRQRFHEELAELEGQTPDGLDIVIQQLDRALEWISYQDVELAGMSSPTTTGSTGAISKC